MTPALLNLFSGYMSVDGAPTVTGRSEGGHVGLELITPLYVGGVPQAVFMNPNANYSIGFEGCISRLVVQDSIVELMSDANEKVGW